MHGTLLNVSGGGCFRSHSAKFGAELSNENQFGQLIQLKINLELSNCNPLFWSIFTLLLTKLPH